MTQKIEVRGMPWDFESFVDPTKNPRVMGIGHAIQEVDEMMEILARVRNRLEEFHQHSHETMRELNNKRTNTTE